MRSLSKIFFLGVIGCWSALLGDEPAMPIDVSQEAQKSQTWDENKTNQVVIRSILLAPNEEALKNCVVSTEGVINCSVILPGDSEKLLQELEKKYLGHPLTQEETIKIKRAIIRYYRSEQHPAVDVQIREQSNGAVAFIITEAGFIFQGDRWISKDHLEKYIDIATGENIAQDVLLNNVDYLNRNPFRRSVVVFPPDSEEGTSDLKFLAGERFPVRFFLGGDNSGTKFTGRARIYGGLTWGHVFYAKDVIHYQYSCNPNPHKFQSHYGTYIAFLPWENIIALSGRYETTDSSKGKVVQAAFRYMVPLEPLDMPLKQEGTMGLEYKNINTNRFFIETQPIRSRFVNITHLLMNYSLERAWKKNEVELSIEVFISPGKVFANQNDTDYDALRPHAKNQYIYARATLGDVYKLPRRFSVAGALRLQAATCPLLPSEQFGLGGYNTVRGYHERAFNADEALCINGELRFPSLTFSKKGELIFLGFMDYGLGFNLHPSAGNPSSGHLFGMGPGARFQIDTHFSVRGDWGFRLAKVPGTKRHGNIVHVGVVGLF